MLDASSTRLLARPPCALFSLSVHLLLLIHTELPWTHVDQEEKTAADRHVSFQGRAERDQRAAYTIDKIWKKSYLAKSFCG